MPVMLPPYFTDKEVDYYALSLQYVVQQTVFGIWGWLHRSLYSKNNRNDRLNNNIPRSYSFSEYLISPKGAKFIIYIERTSTFWESLNRISSRISLALFKKPAS